MVLWIPKLTHLNFIIIFWACDGLRCLIYISLSLQAFSVYLFTYISLTQFSFDEYQSFCSTIAFIFVECYLIKVIVLRVIISAASVMA